jgi:hypothetical protein
LTLPAVGDSFCHNFDGEEVVELIGNGTAPQKFSRNFPGSTMKDL